MNGYGDGKFFCYISCHYRDHVRLNEFFHTYSQYLLNCVTCTFGLMQFHRLHFYLIIFRYMIIIIHVHKSGMRMIVFSRITSNANCKGWNFLDLLRIYGRVEQKIQIFSLKSRVKLTFESHMETGLLVNHLLVIDQF